MTRLTELCIGLGLPGLSTSSKPLLHDVSSPQQYCKSSSILHMVHQIVPETLEKKTYLKQTRSYAQSIHVY